jgi:hypothetical protein
MKTIFDKIDPKYIECTAGSCEHTAHSNNGVYWAILIVALMYTTYKYCYGTYRTRDTES